MKACLVLIVFACLGCKKPEDSSSSSTATPASTDLATTKSPPAGAAKQLEPSQNINGLVAGLQQEAQNRPVVKVPAEKVYAALERVGIKIQGPQQAAGWTMNANFCMSGQTGDGVVVAVCEYADATKASAGKAFMDKQFDFGLRGKRVVNDRTVMTVVVPDAEKQRDIVAKATSTFASL